MKGVATSDLHLTFRRHPATVGGRNAREQDVEKAWDAAVTRIIDAQPDLVTIAGDCFDHARPTTHALLAFQRGINRILRETNAYVVVIPGNHEGSKTIEALTPVVLVAELGHRVIVVQEPARVAVTIERTGERCAIDCFPFGVLGQAAAHELVPDPSADVTMLLIHAAVRSSASPAAVPSFYAGPEKVDVGLFADQYDVIACGDFHEFRRLHPERLAFYSGSIERTSSNIWEEHAPKGVVAYDTADGSLELLEIPTRQMGDWDLGDFDLPPGVGADELNDVLRQMADRESLRGSMTRLKVDGFPREERDSIDQMLVRRLRDLCLHFNLDLRFREVATTGAALQREAMARSLDDEAAAFFAEDAADVRECALEFLGGVS